MPWSTRVGVVSSQSLGRKGSPPSRIEWFVMVDSMLAVRSTILPASARSSSSFNVTDPAYPRTSSTM